ncbi:MAG TPA: hypothetical protein VGI90_19740 [Steroidobacteraceae bacterium]|jgi:hypothetical protein
MASAEEETELVGYIGDLIEVTSRGGTNWNKFNPTTFVWDISIPSHPARLVLQQVAGAALVHNKGLQSAASDSSTKYVFQAIDLTIPQGAPVLIINGADSDLLNRKLRELFNTISGKESRKGLDFLGSIIADAKRRF